MKSLRNIWDGLRDSHIVDHTRLRLDDGTPLHAGKLRRIFANASNLAAAGYFTLAVAHGSVSDPEKLFVNMGINGAYFLCAAALLRWRQKNMLTLRFGENYNGLCFNTKPEELTTKPNHYMVAHSKMVGDSWFSFIPLSWIIIDVSALAISPQDMTSRIPMIATEAYMATDVLLSRYRFKKVVDDEWTIEEAPKPKKVLEKEKVPVLERLGRLLPAPRPAV